MSRRSTGWALVAAGFLLLAAGLVLAVIARGEVDAPPTGPAERAPGSCVIDRADVDARVAAGADPTDAVAELLAGCDR